MTIDYDKNYVGGQWIPTSSTDRITVTSASTEEVLGSVPSSDGADVDAAVSAARRAFDDPTGWSTWDPARRRAALERFADELEARSAEFVARVSGQNGMPVKVGRRTEGAVPAAIVRYYAGLAQAQDGEEIRTSLVRGSTVIGNRPIGVVAAVVPWNFPQILSFFKIAPALAAGCTVVLKPASETVLDAFLIGEATAAAELPPGVLNIIAGTGRGAGQQLVTHPGVDKVGFTGSTEVGRHLAAECGRLIRPITLELGGKSAAVVLDDVDVDQFTRSLFETSFINSGQSCFISTRILLPRSRYTELVDAITDTVRSYRIGDPFDPATLIGPLVSAGQRASVEGYIEKGRAEGGRITTGGGRPAGLDRGWYVEPSVIADVDNDATVSHEEIFGPVVSLIPYTDDAEAVALANASDYGLGGTVWTADVERGRALASRVVTGSIGVNGFTMDLGSPFGGVKASGLGRELGPEGLAAYRRLQSIYLP
ncbi:aldehyde dehydrogenase [Gordonia caeni]|uniref:Aldehyde dehydrogenase n=1 Tax=Gordonia caeni TaxID=1007097 RepID=A0ABP7NUR6_9ACTN